jgi:hypothetical protein
MMLDQSSDPILCDSCLETTRLTCDNCLLCLEHCCRCSEDIDPNDTLPG